MSKIKKFKKTVNPDLEEEITTPVVKKVKKKGPRPIPETDPDKWSMKNYLNRYKEEEE